MKKLVAWTGGDRPKKLNEVSKEEREFISNQFKWHCRVWLEGWKEKKIPFEYSRIFWRWARYDSHATFRT